MNQIKFEIRQLAQKMIDNKIDFVEGCRKIAQLSNYLDNLVLFNKLDDQEDKKSGCQTIFRKASEKSY